jgi:hypothetical protein
MNALPEIVHCLLAYLKSAYIYTFFSKENKNVNYIDVPPVCNHIAILCRLPHHSPPKPFLNLCKAEEASPMV